MQEVKIEKVLEWRFPSKVTVVFKSKKGSDHFYLQLHSREAVALVQQVAGRSGSCGLYSAYANTVRALGATISSIDIVCNKDVKQTSYMVLDKGGDIYCVSGNCGELLAFALHCALPINFYDEESMASSYEEQKQDTLGATSPSTIPKAFRDAFERLDKTG